MLSLSRTQLSHVNYRPSLSLLRHFTVYSTELSPCIQRFISNICVFKRIMSSQTLGNIDVPNNMKVDKDSLSVPEYVLPIDLQNSEKAEGSNEVDARNENEEKNNSGEGNGEDSPQKSNNMLKRDIRRKNAYIKRQQFMIEKKRKRVEKAREDNSQNKEDPVESLSDDLFNKTEYYQKNGLRKVYPYYFTYSTHAKGRWLGRTLYDVFTTEFYAHSKEQFVAALDNGRILVNGETTNGKYVLKNNDCVSSRRHRHELPILDQPIEIIDETSDLLVVNKPSSMPIHPCGRYRFNTLTFILAKENGYRTLRPTYRLDRLTSGVVIFAKNWLRAKQITQYIAARKVSKEYVCKVAGRFPEHSLICSEPIDILSHKMGVLWVRATGKEAKTTFELMHYNKCSDTSVVSCKPETGRTHQIRIHLQYLGYPIVNDPIYNTALWGPNKGKGGHYGGQTMDELIEKIPLFHNKDEYLISAQLEGERYGEGTVVEKTTFDPDKLTLDDLCDECKQRYRDPTDEQLTMYLHALRYRGPDWDYQTPLPTWAHPEIN